MRIITLEYEVARAGQCLKLTTITIVQEHITILTTIIIVLNVIESGVSRSLTSATGICDIVQQIHLGTRNDTSSVCKNPPCYYYPTCQSFPFMLPICYIIWKVKKLWCLAI